MTRRLNSESELKSWLNGWYLIYCEFSTMQCSLLFSWYPSILFDPISSYYHIVFKIFITSYFSILIVASGQHYFAATISRMNINSLGRNRLNSISGMKIVTCMHVNVFKVAWMLLYIICVSFNMKLWVSESYAYYWLSFLADMILHSMVPILNFPLYFSL